MTPFPLNRRQHLLLYEPRTEGHHLGWLRFITEDLLSVDQQLTLAVDLRPANAQKIRGQLGEFGSQVKFINAYAANGRRHGDQKSGSVAFCLRESGAANVFLCAFDEIASHCWRRAAFGFLPPPELRGRMGGIYHRPRFLAAPKRSPNRWLKQIGFQRLLRAGWLRQLLFVDECLARERQNSFPAAPVFFLPDPCPAGYGGDRAAAQKQLSLPPGKCVLLFYGTGARRKGLHLAVQAMLRWPVDSPAFLFCVGQQNPAGETARGLETLIQQNRAALINRYVSETEEKNCFAASDIVLLPYLNHFGTSGVLSRAMASAKPVIVSDEQLLGRLTRAHHLGLVFPSGDVSALGHAIRQATQLSATENARFAAAAQNYANIYSRETFRAALLRALASN